MPPSEDPPKSFPDPAMHSVSEAALTRCRERARHLGITGEELQRFTAAVHDKILHALNEDLELNLRYLIAHIGEEATLRHLEDLANHR